MELPVVFLEIFHDNYTKLLDVMTRLLYQSYDDSRDEFESRMARFVFIMTRNNPKRRAPSVGLSRIPPRLSVGARKLRCNYDGEPRQRQTSFRSSGSFESPDDARVECYSSAFEKENKVGRSEAPSLCAARVASASRRRQNYHWHTREISIKALSYCAKISRRQLLTSARREALIPAANLNFRCYQRCTCAGGCRGKLARANYVRSGAGRGIIYIGTARYVRIASPRLKPRFTFLPI